MVSVGTRIRIQHITLMKIRIHESQANANTDPDMKRWFEVSVSFNYRYIYRYTVKRGLFMYHTTTNQLQLQTLFGTTFLVSSLK
jgi:hypothetical protein